MKYLMKLKLIIYCLLIYSCATVPTKDLSTTTSIIQESQNSAETHFTFADGLRRFEVVLIGTIPFTLMFTNIGYGIGRYFYHGLTSGFSSNIAQQNQPQLFDTAAFSSDEKGYMLLAALSGSFLIATIDIIIEIVKQSSGELE